MGRLYTKLTLKKLYGRSGGQCSFLGCEEEIIQREHADTNISEICHIEAHSEGGPRYNPNNTEPDGYDNLILLCRNHHKIIDEKAANGEWLYSVEQLKDMKRSHELSVSNRMVTRPPSLLNRVIKELAKTPNADMRSTKPDSFDIAHKLEFNEVNRNYRIIEKYAVFAPYLDNRYDEFEVHEHEAILENINDEYLKNYDRDKSSDVIWEAVERSLITRMHQEGGIEYSEDLSQSVRMVMVHGFMECKILEAPKA